MTACPLCKRPTEDGVHDRCRFAVDHRLEQIPGLYAALAAVLEPGRAAGARVSGSRTPPLPVRLEPLSLRGRGGIITILATWETDWRDRAGLAVIPARAGREQLLDSDQALADVIAFLRRQLGWAIAYHPAVDEFAGEVRAIVQECHRAVGALENHMRIGSCPAVDDDGRPCGRPLHADPYSDWITCDRCGATWSRDQWLMLGRAMNTDQPNRTDIPA